MNKDEFFSHVTPKLRSYFEQLGLDADEIDSIELDFTDWLTSNFSGDPIYISQNIERRNELLYADYNDWMTKYPQSEVINKIKIKYNFRTVNSVRQLIGKIIKEKSDKNQLKIDLG